MCLLNEETEIPRRSAPRRYAPVVGILVVLSLYYAFVVTAGTFGALRSQSDFYDKLAQGFQAGHLYIPDKPKARLLKRADPWHYKSDREWRDWLWDASLYQKRYYIYWGPIPAVMLLLVKVLTPYVQTIHDQWLVLLFMVLRLCAGAALIRCYAKTQYPALPQWTVHVAILVFGLASPTPYFMARPLVYEASVAGGQAFLFIGLYCAYRGLLRAEKRSTWFVAAGTFFACAMGSRGSLLVATPVVIAATVLCSQRSAGYPLHGLLRASLAIGAPFAIGVGLYAVYNYQRFDSIFEFGLKYQLTGAPFGNENAYFLPNLVSYLTSELHWSCAFPYVRLPRERHLTDLITWPEGYDTGERWNGETAAGILVATTICWFWGAWLLRAILSLSRGRHARDITRDSTQTASVSLSTRELWLLMSSVGAICALGPASRMWMANMRFLQDAAGGILLGALGGAFWLLNWNRNSPTNQRVPFLVLYSILAIHTCFIGVCLGFTGHTDSFISENKPLSRTLVKNLSICRLKREIHQLGKSTR